MNGDAASGQQLPASPAAARPVRPLSFWLLAGVVLAGCGTSFSVPPAPPPLTVRGTCDEFRQLQLDRQKEVHDLVELHCGPSEDPLLLGNDQLTSDQLERGWDVYGIYCAICHGVTGDGQGIIANELEPRPRDFRRGVFKFQSTPFGARPLRADLLKSVRRGLPGTLMPPFARLPTADLEAVVDYVLALSRRAELERDLSLAAGDDGELSPEIVEGVIQDILVPWEESAGLVIRPLNPQPMFTTAHVERGRQAFTARGCSKCHGEDGKGQTAENLRGGLRDYWGFPAKAADLTSGRLKGGAEPLDIYRRILGGINGTPMPSFRATLASEPDTLWDLVAYVLHLSGSAGRSSAAPGDAPLTAPSR